MIGAPIGNGIGSVILVEDFQEFQQLVEILGVGAVALTSNTGKSIEVSGQGTFSLSQVFIGKLAFILGRGNVKVNRHISRLFIFLGRGETRAIKQVNKLIFMFGRGVFAFQISVGSIVQVIGKGHIKISRFLQATHSVFGKGNLFLLPFYIKLWQKDPKEDGDFQKQTPLDGNWTLQESHSGQFQPEAPVSDIWTPETPKSGEEWDK